MTKPIFRALAVLLFLLQPQTLMAQQTAWIQIEARPSLTEAQARARYYAARLPRVNGFALGTGWYAIALGPYEETQAKAIRSRLRASGQIPRDSFVADGRGFGLRFWPIGAGAAPIPAPAPAPAEQTPQTPDQPAAQSGSQIAPAAGETPAQARAAEARLPRQAREDLQRALAWQGHYAAAIDGDFGPGTRRAMAAYQQAEGFEPTGILTTAQRRQLMGDYQKALSELGMKRVVDETAGIAIELPMAMLKFDSYDYPFAHYNGRDGSKVRAILISQRGNERTLIGLYDVMQSLAIVPRGSKGDKKRRSFTLTGSDNSIASYSYAALEDGQIKGFTLVWPAGDKRRMQRLIDRMQASFTALPEGVLDETMRRAGADQNIDLLAGLELRKPARTHSGFFVDSAGAVVTLSDVADSCRQITIGDERSARIVATDETLGLSVLRPDDPLAPPGYARFREGAARLNSEIAVAGYSYGGSLGAPTLSFGQLADIRGLAGEAELARLSVTTLPGDAGGPVLAGDGTVLGILMPKPDDSGRKLPGDVAFMTNADAVAAMLADARITAERAGPAAALAPEDLTVLAGQMTVLVSCWN